MLIFSIVVMHIFSWHDRYLLDRCCSYYIVIVYLCVGYVEAYRVCDCNVIYLPSAAMICNHRLTVGYRRDTADVLSVHTINCLSSNRIVCRRDARHALILRRVFLYVSAKIFNHVTRQCGTGHSIIASLEHIYNHHAAELWNLSFICC